MDSLEIAVLEAWHRLAERVRKDRVEAGRRAARRLGRSFSRPPRAWCLALRAGDSRITPMYSLFEPAEKWAALRRAHTINLDAPALRALCAPVRIPWPGVPWKHAADLLGRDPTVIARWIKRGLLQVRYKYCRSEGYRGKPRPMVWSDSPLNPMIHEARAPHPVWGTLWQNLHERIPEDLTLRVERTPIARPRRRSDFWGWRFTCPGLPVPPTAALSGRCSASLSEGSAQAHSPRSPA